MVRLKDIARQTGLTISTVSKALNHSKEISRETSGIVWKAAREMGYIAQKAAGRVEKTIGVILPEIDSQYYARLMDALNQEIVKNGYAMITMLKSGYSSRLEPYMEQMSKYNPDGMIICCDTAASEGTFQAVLDCRIPSLLLNENLVSFPIDSICIEESKSVRLAVTHLLQLGHKRIGYLGDKLSDVRYHSFCDLMRENHLEVDPRFVKRGDVRFEQGGYQLACELLKEPELPTAIVASYDQVALGAMRAFQENGIGIPRDLSIVGFDNIVMDNYCHVPLTSVTNPVEQMGVTAVKILLDAIQNPSTHVVQNVSLQSRLVARESTCALENKES